ncbi:MAG: hypothetical protein ACOX2F_11230 [bacterium]
MRLFIALILSFFFFVGCGDGLVKDACSKACKYEKKCEAEDFFDDYDNLGECIDECVEELNEDLDEFRDRSKECGSAYEKFLKCSAKHFPTKCIDYDDYDYDDEYDDPCESEYSKFLSSCGMGDDW